MEEIKKENITAQKYYNESRKKTFLYSRILVGISLCILIIGLALNITLLNSTQRTTLQSSAATTTLPELPENCMYETKNQKTVLICATPIPQVITSPIRTTAYPITISLPQLPPQCSYQTTGDGYSIACQSSQILIPPLEVQLPAECKPSVGTIAMTIVCRNTANEQITSALPTLPNGCNYEKNETGFRIMCTAIQTTR